MSGCRQKLLHVIAMASAAAVAETDQKGSQILIEIIDKIKLS